MSNPLMLEGQIALTDTEKLHAEIERLEADLRQTKAKLRDAEHRAEGSIAAITELRVQLGPLHRALRAVFGEIELVLGDDPEPSRASAASSPSPGLMSDRKMSSAWANWIQKLGGHRGAFIQAILDHGALSATQMKTAMGITRQQTVYDVAHVLMKMGLVRKNGEMYDLKD